LGARTFDEADDPIHRVSPPGTGWTRVNMSEAMPGVATPLSWSFMDDATEKMVRGGYHDMGVLSKALLPAPPEVEGRTASIFYGRIALNIDWSRRCADLQPLTSGDALEAAYFGKVREGSTSQQSRRRYPVILLKSPPLAARTPRRLRRLYREGWAWWQGEVAAGPRDLAGARAQFVEAKGRFDVIARTHVAAALLGGTLYPLLGSLTAAVGRPELMTSLLGGHQSVEIETTTDLWDVAHGRSSVDEFVRRRGFQGAHQGELSAHVWREDRRPVERLVETFRTMGDDADPRRVERRSVEVRRDAERELLAGLPRHRRLEAQAVLRFAHTYVPLRETGKAALMTAFDVARLAARTVGAELARAGVLDDAEDVFCLTMDELAADHVPDVRELVAFRRSRRERYQQLELPESWVGMVEPLPAASADGDRVTGLGVSPGVTEGRARVIADPSTDDLEPGEILVCETTDPSWAAYFLVAAGVVNDIGSAMSHGSIVAREVGIPCVTNTRNGTRVLRTGDLVRVDGGAGTVDVLSRAGAGG
jgi:phosphohistidine swiveling domain-containing protein